MKFPFATTLQSFQAIFTCVLSTYQVASAQTQVLADKKPLVILMAIHHEAGDLKGEEMEQVSNLICEKMKTHKLIFGIEGISYTEPSGYLSEMDNAKKLDACKDAQSVYQNLRGYEDREAYYFVKNLFIDFAGIRRDAGASNHYPQFYLLSQINEIPSFGKAWSALELQPYASQNWLIRAYNFVLASQEPFISVTNQQRFNEILDRATLEDWTVFYQLFLLQLVDVVDDPLLPKQDIRNTILNPYFANFEALRTPILIQYRERHLKHTIRALILDAQREGKDLFIVIGKDHVGLSQDDSLGIDKVLNYDQTLEFLNKQYPE